MATKLITDSFPKKKKDQLAHRKSPQLKPRDSNDKGAEVPFVTKDLSVLKEFDLDLEYGPCIGISRLERWERAKTCGLYPPEEVKEIIQRHPNDKSFTECIWYDANL